MKILIFGRGYIGQRLADAWKDEAILSDAYIHSKQDALDAFACHQPDVVLNAAGVRGKPNVDWCEDHQLETMRGNAILPMMLADACAEAGLYLLHMGSGCIFYGDSSHPDRAWREQDHGNPEPVYSRAKWAADLVLSTLPNIAIARIRMPIDWVPSSNNMIDKLATYPKVIDVENSVTIIEDMIDVFHQMLEKKATGIFHVTNPGTMKHRELLDLYHELVDPDHTCEWIANETLVEQGLAKKGRSNNFLSNTRLEEYGIHMRPIDTALRDTMQKYAEAKKIPVREE
jgi:3,5-epimerase/4-reductase